MAHQNKSRLEGGIRNGSGRKITDTRWFEALASLASVAQEAWVSKQSDESWRDAWKRAQDVSADRITEIGVLTTRNAVRDYLSPQQPGESRLTFEGRLIFGGIQYFAGLADDVVDGARARVEDGKYATEHGPLYDALSDRWRENRVVDELIRAVEIHFSENKAAAQLTTQLRRLKQAMGGPSIARALGEAKGYAAKEQTKGSALDRNLELLRLCMLVARGRLTTALTLAGRMEQDAISLVRTRLDLPSETPSLPERGRERTQSIARRRFAALQFVMSRLVARTNGKVNSPADYWQEQEITFPVLDPELTAEELTSAQNAVVKIMALDQQE